MKATATRTDSGFRHTVRVRSHDMTIDEPAESGGNDSCPSPQELLAAIEGTRVVPRQDLAKDFPGNPVDHIYVIDPLGNLMMRFPRDPDPSKILKDVQRLLRLSQIG